MLVPFHTDITEMKLLMEDSIFSDLPTKLNKPLDSLHAMEKEIATLDKMGFDEEVNSLASDF